MLHNRDIVIVGSTRWNIAGKVNCHHIAERLAMNNRVLFVESPGLRSPKPSRVGPGGDLQKIVSRGSDWLRGVASGPTQVSESLHVLSPLAYPMHAHRIAEPVNRHLFAGAVRRCAARMGMTDPLLWIFPPTGVSVLDAYPDAPVIYHCIDHYAGIHGTDETSVNAMQTRLLERAGLVFATSRPLAKALATQHANVVCVPNVSDIEHFLEPRPLPHDLANLPKPIIGYVGHLSTSMIDLAMLSEMVSLRPNWSFVLVGSIGDAETNQAIEQLVKVGNTHLLGPRPYETVPSYVHGFDACIIPFTRNALTEWALPLKTFEYLAAGKPTISTSLEAMLEEPLDGVVSYCNNADEFIRAIEASLESYDDTLQAKRIAAARAYSWETRFPEISQHAERLCLASRSG